MRKSLLAFLFALAAVSASAETQICIPTFNGPCYPQNVIVDGITGVPVSSSSPLAVSASVAPTVDYSITGTIAGAGQTVTTATINSVSTANIVVTGTFSQALSVQISSDTTNYVTLPTITNVATGATSATITAAGTYQVPVPATARIKVITAYTSGSAVVTVRASTGSGGGGGGASGAVTQSGTWTVQPGNTANTTPWLATINQGGNSANVTSANALIVTQSPPLAGSSIVITVDSTAYEASHVISNAAATLLGCYGYSSKASAQFIQIFNSTTVPADTTAPTIAPINVPATSSWSIDFGVYGRPFATGIAISNSSTGPTKTIGSADSWFSCRIK